MYRKEQFNELSELSLEERMAVANQIGIPVENAGDPALTGTMGADNEEAESPTNQPEEESTGGGPGR